MALKLSISVNVTVVARPNSATVLLSSGVTDDALEGSEKKNVSAKMSYFPMTDSCKVLCKLISLKVLVDTIVFDANCTAAFDSLSLNLCPLLDRKSCRSSANTYLAAVR